jgi:hypothetical protein
MQHHLAPVWPVSMFEEIYSLPSAERQASAADGDTDRNLRQSRLDVCRHVVWSLRRMHDPSHRRIRRWWHEAAKEGVEVGANIGIGILLDE